jgi:hypothetical protein
MWLVLFPIGVCPSLITFGPELFVQALMFLWQRLHEILRQPNTTLLIRIVASMKRPTIRYDSG